MLEGLSEEDIKLLKDLWWRNGTTSQEQYGKSNPQLKVQDWMQPRRDIERRFVICSEACWEKVYTALRIMDATSFRRDWAVILAVDRVTLSIDNRPSFRIDVS